MKKISILAVVALFTLGLTSCKKDYTCTCTNSAGTASITYTDAKKKDAQEACDTLHDANVAVGGSCKLD